MKINRYMVIQENGNISFQKVTAEKTGISVEIFQEYHANTQTELDFAQECQKRFDNEYPDWAGVLTWTMISEEDLEDEIAEMMG